jgi:outer membrane murein-binding lipoprotein Lpp
MTRDHLGALASIAAMPNKLRPILLALMLAAAACLAGCGGSNGPDPSIPSTDARTLLAKITEIRANVDVGSCVVAQSKTDDLLADIDALPSDVNQDVKNALVRGANNLKGLLGDPEQCQSRSATTTTESTTESTTEETTTEKTQPTTTTRTQTQPTTTTQTQTQTNTTPGGTSGGIGPGGL